MAGGTTLSHLQAQNFVLACYAVSLTAGETLQAKRIRHATLRGYVKMACKCHTDLGLPSPRLADTDYISVILDAVKKYQCVPDRREMIHDSMYRHLVHEYESSVSGHPDSLGPALAEWLFLGRWVGMRKSEWCGDSPTSYKTIDDPEWGNRPNALPFIFQDFRFFTQGGAEVVLSKQHWSDTSMEPPRAIAYVELRVRKQKNNDNYQKLLYARLDGNDVLCPVRNAYRIVCRGHRLGLPDTHPAAVYATRAASLAPTRQHASRSSRVRCSTSVPMTPPSNYGVHILSGLRHATSFIGRSSPILISRTAFAGSQIHL